MTHPDRLIELLELEPHPEGGWYRETWRADAAPGSRASGSAIYFLLTDGSSSRLHRIDAAEVWHFYTGAPVAIEMGRPGQPQITSTLGSDLAAGQRPQIVVPPGVWQAARTLGHFSLVGCTVSPAFEMDNFELARPGDDLGS